MRNIYISFTIIFAIFIINPVMGISVSINEFVSSNSGGLTDKDGDHPDWIELYNYGDNPVQLKDYILTDNLSEYKWVFPELILYPGDFKIIFASGKDIKTGSELHTNFSISSSGEPVYLIDPIGVIIDFVEEVELLTNLSYGRQPDGTGDWFYFKEPTPGSSNISNPYSYLYGAPLFSKQAGFYADEFNLTISKSDNKDPEAKIYYTLDGSEPDENSKIYDGSILIKARSNNPNDISEISTSVSWKPPDGNINKATVIRARTMSEAGIESKISNATFFVGNELVNRYTFPVISIKTDNINLFDYDKGIYVKGRIYDENFDPDLEAAFRPANYNQRGIEWERPVHIELFETNGNLALEQNAGIRIHGAYSRSYPVKSLRLYARGSYGESWFNYSFFSNKNIDASKRFLLRNSGNDFSLTLFRDAYIQQLVKSLDIDYQEYIPSVLYINGEYWGIHNIRERIDKYYLMSNHNVDPESINLLSNNAEIKEGSNNSYIELINYIENNDLTNDEHYNWVIQRIDINNYLDYNISQIFVNNDDWPGNNIDFWQLQTPNSKWRWLLFDTDHGYGYKSTYEFNSLKLATKAGGLSFPNPDWSTFMFRNMLKNEGFRTEFIVRFCDYLNSIFKTEIAIQLLEQFTLIYEKEIEEHIHRWGTIKSLDNWYSNIETMQTFAYKRPYYLRKHLIDFFDLGNEYLLRIRTENPEMGYIKINQIELNQNESEWAGFYFDGLPVTVEAISHDGSKFIGWKGDYLSSKSKLNFTISENTLLIAMFEEDPNWEPLLYQPEPWALSENDYIFNYWVANANPGTYPESAAFRQFNVKDPGLDIIPDNDWTLPYNLNSRSRIIGLNANGIAFINTSNAQDMDDAGYIGTMDVYLNTSGVENITVSWQAGTVIQNSRLYGIRLQYRTGNFEPFKDVKDNYGKIVEYLSVYSEGHKMMFYNIKLPSHVNNRENIQLRWKYYHINGDSGPRPMLSIGNITVTSQPIEEKIADKFILFPNPVNDLFNIKFQDENIVGEEISIILYDIMGRSIYIVYNGVLESRSIDYLNISDQLKNGVYFINVTTPYYTTSKRIIYTGNKN